MQKNDIYLHRVMFALIAGLLTALLIYVDYANLAETFSVSAVAGVWDEDMDGNEPPDISYAGDYIDETDENEDENEDNREKTISLEEAAEALEALKAAGRVYVVYVDPGHGGIDDGAVKGGVSEKNINLSIALILYDMLMETHMETGIFPIISRDTDVFVDRYFRAEEGSRLADMIVSIHCNSFEKEYVLGTEIHFTPGQVLDGSSKADINSRELADIMLRNVVEGLGSKDRGVFERSDLALTKYSTVPCVIVEVGYLTNLGERALLQDGAYQIRAAEAVYAGILEAFGVYPEEGERE